ncbi:MAG: CBS domain-containing protein [Coriobacteriales bacterium]|jgi:Mg2+ transporter MgtE|nr:CBS domain-containing protein [Coriobacteriales bacterium]
MFYLSQMLGTPVIDSEGVEIGRINDLAIQTGEVFPRITALAFKGPAKTPFMVSWRKYVAEFSNDEVTLNTSSHNIRFSYLQPDEILLARDLLNKQIVDTQGLKVVRVNDLKLSQSNDQLRLLGAEVGMRGLLRGLNPLLERAVAGVGKVVRRPLEENIIAWNYMELVDRDLSNVKLSVTHRRLHDMHPADIADILEQLDPQQRTKVFDHLDSQQAAETMSELEEEYQSDLIDDLSESEASKLLASMDPDDAADILGDLPYEKAEKLLWLMGVQDQARIRNLLGYKEKTAGGIMTTDFVTVSENATVAETVEQIRGKSEEYDAVHYVYSVDSQGRLIGAVSLRSLVLAAPETRIFDISVRELRTVSPDADQEEVAEGISKYDLLAMPVVDEDGKLLGIVTVDDAFDVIEEEHSEDLQIAGANVGDLGREEGPRGVSSLLRWVLRREMWLIVWVVVSLLIMLAGGISTFAGALVLMPFVLILADNTVNFSISDLLSYDGSKGSSAMARLFGRNLVVAVVILVFGLLVMFALGSTSFGLPSAGQGEGVLLSGEPATTFVGSLGGVATLVLAAFIPTLIASFLIILAGVFITAYSRRRLDKGKQLSNTSMTFAVMLFGLLVQLGLTYVMVELVQRSVGTLFFG